MNPNDYAKSYIDHGWSLIPIIPGTKKPLIKWKEFQDRRATFNEVESWIKDGNWLAIVTGEISGVVILDDDRIKHGLPEWDATSTVISRSKSGGKHYYFKYDRKISSHSNATLHLDIKGWHSYALVPPFDQRIWIAKPSSGLSALVPMPDDLVRIVNSDTRTDTNGNREPLVMTDFLDLEDGARNSSFYKIACSVFRKNPKDDALRILAGVNLTYKPPLNKQEFEARTNEAYRFISTQTIDNKREPAKPLSISTVAERRLSDKSLEKDAPSTGYPELDNLVTGFLPKHFWTLTGETNVGKTALACNLAENVRKQGRRVLYVALEPEYKVVDYLASARTGKRFEDLTDSDIKQDDGLIDVFTLAEVPTYTDLMTSLKSASKKYDLILIDHIGYFCRSSEEKSFLVEQGQTIRDLVGLSKELLTCVVAIAHPRKPSSSQRNRILTLYDVSGSAAFAQDSTEVLVIHRPTVDTKDETCVELSDKGFLLIQKTKAGANGTVYIDFHHDKALVSTNGSIHNSTFEDEVKQAEPTPRFNKNHYDSLPDKASKNEFIENFWKEIKT